MAIGQSLYMTLREGLELSFIRYVFIALKDQSAARTRLGAGLGDKTQHCSGIGSMCFSISCVLQPSLELSDSIPGRLSLTPKAWLHMDPMCLVARAAVPALLIYSTSTSAVSLHISCYGQDDRNKHKHFSQADNFSKCK